MKISTSDGRRASYGSGRREGRVRSLRGLGSGGSSQGLAVVAPCVLALGLWLADAVGAAPHGGTDGGKAGATDGATARHRFDDVPYWSGIFDDPARDAWQKPDELVLALRLAPGATVADLGAGTGYLSRRLSAAVGATGTVLAVEVEPNLVAHLRQRAEREASANLVPILGSLGNPRLPRASVDVLLVLDTYHHVDDRVDYFRRLGEVLRDGGRIAIVDWKKEPLPVGPPLDHKVAREQVVEEMVRAGYRLDESVDVLPYQYFLVFRPVASAARDPAPTPSD